MNQQHMSVEYTVIDENVVLDALENERDLESKSSKHDQVNRLGGAEVRSPKATPEETIRLEEVETLRLSYKNILRIDNLVGFKALHTLCLDNNVIEEIENLGHLVNLQWLDLSFNNIKSIQGLEKLVHLKDLSLYSNNIDTIANLDKCSELECLSIGRNKINKLEDLLYLRQFKKLRLVTLDGNPVCKDPEYRMYVLAHLEHLKYLDYALVDKNEVVSAREQYQDELLEAEERETLEEANEKAAKQHEEYMERLRTAHLEILETLFKEMFAEDKELPKLRLLPGFDTIYDSYRHEYAGHAETAINAGLEIYERFVAENGRVEAAVDKVTKHNEDESIRLIEAFNKAKKQLAHKIRTFIKAKREESVLQPSYDEKNNATEDNGQTQEKLLRNLEELDKQRHELRENLMTIEVQQVQQLKKLVDVYENRGGALRTERVDHATQFFRTVEDLENSFAQALEELAQNLMEKLANNVLEDLSDETIAFLSDRDNLMVAIQGAHDVHLGKLLAQEDSLREGINNELSEKVKTMKQAFNQQNRDRIFEVMRMHQSTKSEIDQLTRDLQGVDEEENF